MSSDEISDEELDQNESIEKEEDDWLPSDEEPPAKKPKIKKPQKLKSNKSIKTTKMVDGSSVTWKTETVLGERLDISDSVSRNVKNMLDEGCTVPFIARYRKEKTNNMDAEKLREFQVVYEELKSVQTRVASVMKSIKTIGKLTNDLKQAIQSSQTMMEVEHLYAPYKPGNKRSLAERAKEAGLEDWADQVINKPWEVNLNQAVKIGEKGRNNIQEVEKGVQHIIADRIAKDEATRDMVRDKLNLKSQVFIESHKRKSSDKMKKEKDLKEDNSYKFEKFFDFSTRVANIKPHVMLALNRGESQKILSIKINIPNFMKTQFTQCWRKKWIHRKATQYSTKLVQDSIEDCYSRLIQPLLVSGFRSELTKTAEKAAIDVFATNLKNLLLTPPVRGKVVMGVDPGYKNGCKYAVTSITGHVLETGVVYLHNKQPSEVTKLKQCLLRHRCETVAIGNGTACRLVESIISDNIKARTFHPLNISYCIVNENGASIYSASEEAQKELPDLDVTLRGAVSIARRLQDPLVELVKIEPRHIGVGMYQHDVTEKELKSSLEGIVQECVSFVGIDLNVCTEYLLRHVSGLNITRAKNIIKWREEHGSFTNREQLLAIRGLGPKSYEQCAGFVRILPKTSINDVKHEKCPEKSVEPEDVPVNKGKRKATSKAGGKSKKAKTSETGPNPLDMTCIHPESYQLTQRFLDDVGINLEDVGSQSAINKTKAYIKTHSVEYLAEKFKVGAPTMKLITDGIQQTLDHDIRQEFEKPLFRQGLMSMDDLRTDQKCTGKVVNVTHFGAFVDLGVGQDGLIHTSQMSALRQYNKDNLDLGDRVEVVIQKIEHNKKRIGLRLHKLL